MFFYLKCNLVICVGKVFRIEISVQKLPFSSLWRQYTESSLHHAALEYIAFGYVLWKDPQASIHLKLPYITTQGLQRKIEIKEKQVDYIMILILALDSPEKKEETHPEPLLVAHYTQVLRPLFVGNRAHTPVNPLFFPHSAHIQTNSPWRWRRKDRRMPLLLPWANQPELASQQSLLFFSACCPPLQGSAVWWWCIIIQATWMPCTSTQDIVVVVGQIERGKRSGGNYTWRAGPGAVPGFVARSRVGRNLSKEPQNWSWWRGKEETYGKSWSKLLVEMSLKVIILDVDYTVLEMHETYKF